MKRYGVIMAGGGGTRFWPLSRQAMPKQMLNLSGKDRMINETIDRLHGTVEKEDIFIVTNEKQAAKMLECVDGRIAKDHILAEPSARNTAACIGYAAMEIVKKYGDGIMCIFPSDHFIKNEPEFTKILNQAVQAAEEQDKLITIGIAPTFPSTGYGYIKFDKNENAIARKVEEFKLCRTRLAARFEIVAAEQLTGSLQCRTSHTGYHIVADQPLTCTITDETHVHGPRCYGTWVLTCGLEEHTHTEACYSTKDTLPDGDADAAVHAQLSGRCGP